MRPRLFWTVLAAFALVILLGVCGMLSFFGLALSGAIQAGPITETFTNTQTFYRDTLGDYYTAHGNSWSGIERRLEESPFGGEMGAMGSMGYVIVDTNGQVVASNDRSYAVGGTLGREQIAKGLPVESRGERVGTLVLHPGGSADGPNRRAPEFVGRVMRGFLGGSLAIVGVLLGVAAVFAGWLARPIRGMTSAARSLESGKLDVQVRNTAVRELDDLARAFNAMAHSLSEADRQRRQMTADIAHELRTPLTIIKGRLEGLQDGVYQATPDQIGRLLHETDLLERLIEDLRLLALAEAGQLPLFSEPTDPTDLLEDAVASFAAEAAEQGVQLRVQANSSLPQLDVDPQRMAQVLSNLIANSLRHTPNGGTITLAVECEAQESRPKARAVAGPPALGAAPSVIMRVSDTGQGIAEADLPHIFDRFWRADRSRTRTSGGSGLGLAIAKQIVLAHHGAIWAESAHGQGTTISIALPAQQEPS